MIIEHIELTHVGPFGTTVFIGPLDPGLNVLSANNEAGKSTVIRATSRALFDRHTCKSEEIKGLQRLGTSLAPSVTVAFESGGQKYRVVKVFLESPRCQVSQWNAGEWQLKAEGDAADLLLQQILLSEQPGRGATKPEHWGLFQYLWTRQGEPAVWPSWQGEAGKLVQSRLIRIELDPLIESLKTSLSTEYSQILTDQGRSKTRGPLDLAEKELQALQTKLADIQGRKQHIESAQARYQDLNARLAELEKEALEKRQAAEVIAEQARQAELLLKELEARQGQLTVATEKLQVVVKDIATVTTAWQTIEELIGGIASDELRQQKYDDQETKLVEQQRAGDKDLEEATRRRTELQDDLDRIQTLLKYRGALDTLAKLKDQLKKSKSLAGEVDRLEREQSKLPSLTPQKLKKLELLEQDIKTLTAQIEAVGLSVEITPTKAAEVEVTKAGSKTNLSIRTGATETLHSGQSLDLKLKSWGRIRVRSGSTELHEIEEQRKTKATQLDEALAELGVKDVVAAATLTENLRGLASRIRDVQRDLTAALGDHEDIKHLEGEINAEDTRLSNVEAASKISPAEKTATVTDLEARHEELRSAFRGKDRQVQSLTNASKELVDALTECRKNRNALAQQLARLQERLKSIKTQVEEIEGRYQDGMDAAKGKAQEEFTKAEARVATTRAKLPPEADKLPERNRRAARAAHDVAQELERIKGDRDRLVGELKTRGSDGLYAQETQLLEKITQVTSELEAARRRGWAARLLYDLLKRRKQVATRAVLTPIQDRLSSTFAELTADAARKVFLDENLQIRGVGRNEHELLAFDLLSQGAKEQLLLAVRLAVALAVTDGERQLLILDDVLVNTDPVRQQRVLDLLHSAAEQLQILVLTCHADRYRGIGHSVNITDSKG